MTAVVVTIPIKTVSEANARDNRWTKAKRAAEQRNVVRMRMYAPLRSWRNQVKHFGGAIITLTRIAPGLLNPHDNLPRSLKAVVDGLCDALGVPDEDPRLTFRYGQEKMKRFTAGRLPANKYAVRIEIERMEQEAL